MKLKPMPCRYFDVRKDYDKYFQIHSKYITSWPEGTIAGWQRARKRYERRFKLREGYAVIVRVAERDHGKINVGGSIPPNGTYGA